MRSAASSHLRQLSNIDIPECVVHTCDSNPVNVIRHHPLCLDDTVELRTRAMQNDRVQANPVQEAKAEREFVDLVEHGTTNLDDSKLCRVCGVGRRGEDAKVTLDLALGTDGVQQTSDSVLDGTTVTPPTFA